MSEDTSALIQRATDIWKKAQLVYQGPGRYGDPVPLQIAVEIAEKHPDCQDALIGLLDSECQLVAAYALLTLEMMGSDVLTDLPAGLLDRRQQITLHMGSVRNSMDLGGLARQVQKRARLRRHQPPASDRTATEGDKKG
jgi:hypothetical protein